jgi:hypothetical protein
MHWTQTKMAAELRAQHVQRTRKIEQTCAGIEKIKLKFASACVNWKQEDRATPARMDRPKPNRSKREQELMMRRPSTRSHQRDHGWQKSRQAAEWTAEPEEKCSWWPAYCSWNWPLSFLCYKKQKFNLQAMYLWSVHDFKAYDNFASWSVHEELTCPICGLDTDYFRLTHGGKISYCDCHIRWLPWKHKFKQE